MADLADRLVPVARALLDPGETLTGCCVATWQKTFSGGMVAIAVSPTRIVVQRLDRRFTPTGTAISLPPDRIARAELMNGIGGSVSAPSLILDAVSITVALSPVDGDRLRLMLMGSGGQIQHDGIAALLSYLEPLLEASP
ncbi:MAG: hypothetical protein ABI566_14130 [Pseudolysinimonas sp.]